MAPSLYIHIPFCKSRCIYCDFVSGIYSPDKADAYIDALKRELDSIPDKTLFSSLFIGGGTPTVLPERSLKNLLEVIFKRFTFEDGYEATLEVNPGTIDSEKLESLHESGINRLSIGVQSFNNDELHFLGRSHSDSEAHDAVQDARKAGFNNVGIDLIYGLPGQHIDKWKRSLETAVSLSPTHISSYELTLEKETAFYEMIHNPGNKDIIIPDEDRVIEMFEYTIDFLTTWGYKHYEISNFSLPGLECRHNLNYWDRGEYYGAGLGAHSFINNNRTCNTKKMDEYILAAGKGERILASSEKIQPHTALSEAIFLGLRKTEGINIETLARKHGINLLVKYEQEIEELSRLKLIKVCESRCSYESNIRLTRKGLLLSNEVLAKFI